MFTHFLNKDLCRTVARAAFSTCRDNKPCAVYLPKLISSIRPSLWILPFPTLDNTRLEFDKVKDSTRIRAVSVKRQEIVWVHEQCVPRVSTNAERARDDIWLYEYNNCSNLTTLLQINIYNILFRNRVELLLDSSQILMNLMGSCQTNKPFTVIILYIVCILSINIL